MLLYKNEGYTDSKAHFVQAAYRIQVDTSNLLIADMAWKDSVVWSSYRLTLSYVDIYSCDNVRYVLCRESLCASCICRQMLGLPHCSARQFDNTFPTYIKYTYRQQFPIYNSHLLLESHKQHSESCNSVFPAQSDYNPRTAIFNIQSARCLIKCFNLLVWRYGMMQRC